MGQSDENEKSGRISYVTIPVADLSAGKKLPAPIYIFLNQRMVKYRNKDDLLDAALLNKLILNQVTFVFIEDTHKTDFEKWIEASNQTEVVVDEPIPADANDIVIALADERRAVMDLFTVAKDEPQVRIALDTSKKIVTEFLKKPYVINNISTLQKYSKGTVDHSVNVSLLSVFLGMRMGYTHQLILENLAVGGLFHDIGKGLMKKTNDLLKDDDEKELRKHPAVGAAHLVKMKESLKDKISNEVIMIVAQHHEYMDGSGYPDALKGTQIYDLSRIVTIANTYDELISESTKEKLRDRCFEAIDKLEKNFEGKLEPRKLEKAVKILKYSLN